MRPDHVTIKTKVYSRNPARFDMTGQRLATGLTLTSDEISQGLAKRLRRYAEMTLEENGFLDVVKDWEVMVETMDAKDKPADRAYSVRWTNAMGGSLSVVGILTRSGWPTLDHGLDIERA